MNVARLIVLIFLFISNCYLKASEVEVSSASFQKAFYDKIYYAEASGTSFQIAKIANVDRPLGFKEVPFGVNFPYPSKAYWIYFDVKNIDTCAVEQILAIQNPNIDHIQLYKTIDGELVGYTETGDNYPLENDELQYLDFAFRITVPEGARMRLIFYVENNTDEIFLPFVIGSPHLFIEHETGSVLFRLLKVGILLFAFLAMLFISVVMQTRLSVYFVLYLLSISLFLTHAWGINRHYLFLPNELWGVKLSAVFPILTVIFAQLFNRLFLDIPRSSPLAGKIIKVMLGLSCFALLTLLLPAQYQVVSQGSVIFLAMIGSIASPIYSALCIKKNPRPSIIVFISSLPIFYAVGMYVLRFYGLFKSDSLLQGFDNAVVVELIIITIGIVDQHRYTLTKTVGQLKHTSEKLEDQKKELQNSNETLTATVAEKEQMQVQLLQVHKLETIGKLAGGIAHDFNNLLTPIIGYTEMTLDEVDTDCSYYEDLTIVLNSAKRAKELVNQILTFSRHFKEQVQYVLVEDIIDEVVLLLQSIIPKNVEIVFDSRFEQKLYVYADPTQIHQVLMNICTNAYHAIGNRGGTISISYRSVFVEAGDSTAVAHTIIPGNYILVTITDNGTGMKSETVRRIFDPFFTTKEVGKGTGLGLSVVHGIVKKLGGAIEVESHVGQGSKFSVYLPVAEKIGLSEDELSAANEDFDADGELIVVVDDEPQVLSVLNQILNRKGFRTVPFNDPNKALEYCEQKHAEISLVITDEVMPKMKGSELAVLIQQIDDRLPIMLITGYSENIQVDNFSKYGVTELLLKPIEPSKLLEKTRAIIRHIKL